MDLYTEISKIEEVAEVLQSPDVLPTEQWDLARFAKANNFKKRLEFILEIKNEAFGYSDIDYFKFLNFCKLKGEAPGALFSNLMTEIKKRVADINPTSLDI